MCDVPRLGSWDWNQIEYPHSSAKEERVPDKEIFIR